MVDELVLKNILIIEKKGLLKIFCYIISLHKVYSENGKKITCENRGKP